jgi:hypothetical protein
MAVADWGGMLILEKVLGTQPETQSFMYFFGMALVVFSLRRIGDRRGERAKLLAAEQHAQTMSMRDPLTQLPNRRQFQNDVSNVLKDSDNKMSVLSLGLSQFKKLNEVYGHLGCDEALLQIGSRIRERAAPGDFFARIATTSLPCACRAATPNMRAGSPVRWSTPSGRRSRSASSSTRSAPASGSPRPAAATDGRWAVALRSCALSRARAIHTASSPRKWTPTSASGRCWRRT